MNMPLTYQFKWVWSLTRGYRAGLSLYFFLELLAILCSLLFVLWSKEVVDIAVKASTGTLKHMIFLVVLAMLLTLICRTCSGWLSEKIRLKMGLELQRQMVDYQMRSVWKQVKDWHSGDIQLRILSDCNEVVQMIGFSAIASLLTLIRLVGSFGVLWAMDPMLAIILLAITPLFLCSKIYFKKMRILSRKVKTAESNFSKMLQENLHSRMLIRAMDLLGSRQAKLTHTQSEIYTLKKAQLNFVYSSQTAMRVTMQAGFILTFIWGVYQLNTGAISFGTMTAFLQLVGRVQAPVLTLFGFVPAFIRFRTSMDRLIELKAVETEPENPRIKLPGLRAIQLKDVWFQYEDQVLIAGLSTCIHRGESLAIMGSSGKGKTTLFRLLLGMLTPDSGSIQLVDSQGAHSLEASHRINFSYVPQGNSLFSGSVRENLGVDTRSVDEAHLRHILWVACAEFIHQLPQGLDTLIGEAGYGLSEGQAQRIAIARALLRKADIWLFDEVTSALDRQTADRFIERILIEGKEKLCLFITHDAVLRKKCNQTFYMNG